ncbi:MAG: HAMP domain-containing sensor histidine kinase [Candidatus Limiplasma sp.]|nr:HAMP domain-containing sensor histidine kinase [Candidatus Limiplasma sp.]
MRIQLRLKDKMTLWYTLLTLLTVTAFSCALYLMTDYVLSEMLESSVRLSLRQVVAQIENRDGMLTFEDEVPITNSAMFYITEENGSELASYGEDIPLFDAVETQPNEFRVAQGDGQRWLLLDSGVITVERSRLRVRVAGSLATNDRVLSTMRLVFFVSIPILLLLSLLGGLFIAKRSLTPIRQIIRGADRIAQGDLSARIPAARARDELGELTDTLNRMLTSVEETFLREKRFTSDASHELRTPVAVIRAYAESLRAEKGLPPDAAAALDTVIAECARMQRIIAQLLTITRGEEGRYPLCIERLEGRALAEGVAETLAGRLAEKEITLTVDLPEGLTLYADQSLMTELLLNLVENAVKYGKTGGQIHLAAGRQGDMVEIRVRDDGIGIAQEALPHIFERFYRVDSARDRSGTGLGLSIVAWIVRVHQGSVAVQSQPGEGTTFTVRLPDGPAQMAE